MQISETLGNEIKNKFEEDWQDYIDEIVYLKKNKLKIKKLIKKYGLLRTRIS